MLDFALDLRPNRIERPRKEIEYIVPFINRALTALKRIFIVIGIAVAFTLGLLGAIYLSLRSSETKVPDIVGKDRVAAENTISSAGLNFRVRATRPTSEAKPDTVLIQLPHAGEVVKVGQTVAVDISRPTKEGESSTPTSSNANTAGEKMPENTNAANSATNTNDNKPKRKPANKNDNDNRTTAGNANVNPTETPVHNLNSNNPDRSNANRGASNVNRRPVPAPTP
ncbi:MAG TPA: PASTA domain-containing protein [Pyrinomonadaceae bacterium]|nr:PASTA domain-containing protein [Pyrinomonadaceae bacterium]